jgi:hypothetical protein
MTPFLMTLRRPLLLGTLALCLGLTGCDLLGSEDSSDPPAVTSGVYVANAGAFGNQNSSYTVYDPSTDETVRVPSSRPGFASYIQSLTLHEDQVYLLFGETNTVGVFDAQTNEQIAKISGVQNPRYMDALGETAYVSGQDYSPPIAPKLYQIDLSTNTITDSVDVGGSPEDVLATDDRVFVALGGQDGSVAAVDASDLTIEQTFSMNCDAPRSLAMDQQNELLVFCAGSIIRDENFDVVDRTDGAIRVVNPTDGTITTQVSLDTMLTSVSQGQRVFYAPRADEVFAVLAGQSILRFDAATNTVASKVNASGSPIGTIGYDALDERLYVGRAASDVFGASGSITVHRRNGEQTDAFDAGGSDRPGIAPTDLAFRRADR